MQQVLGFSAMETGFGYLAVALTVIVAATISQGLVTKLGVKPVLVVGMALLTIGLVYFTQVSVNGSYAVDLLPGFLIIGVSRRASRSCRSRSPRSRASRGRRPASATGLINTSQQIGGVPGLALRPRSPRRAPPTATTAARRCRSAHVGLQPGVLGRRRLRARLADHDDRRPSPEGHPGGHRRAGDRPDRLTVSQGERLTRPLPSSLAPLRIGSRLLDPREVVMA